MTHNDHFARLRRLRDAATLCPTDLEVRCELADCLETEGATADALIQWRQVLSHDPNNLKAWEGVARCRAGAPDTADLSIDHRRR